MEYSISTIIKNDSEAVHIECSHFDFEVSILQYFIDSDESIAIYDGDNPYDMMRVQDYLNFYAKISKNEHDLDFIINLFELSDIKKMKIKKLTVPQQRLVMIAQCSLCHPSYLFIYEPLDDLDNKSKRIVVQALDILSQRGIKIVTGSRSFRHVNLMAGNAYLLKDETLTPFSKNNDITQESESLRLKVRFQSEYIFIPYKDIMYAESISGVTYIRVRDSDIPTQYTLDELESLLATHGFYRSHRSYLVQLSVIHSITQWTRNSYVILLDDKEKIEIPLSKRRYAGVIALLHSADN